MKNIQRTLIDLFHETATVEELVIEQVPVTRYELVDVPASTTDWSFTSKKRVPYTSYKEKRTWVVVGVRKATNKELDDALYEAIDSFDI